MSSFLLLQQCLACLVHFICTVLEMGGMCPYSCYFVECCFQDLFNMTGSILVQFLSSFFPICLVSIHVVHLYSRIVMTTAWKNLHFILSNMFDFHMVNNLLIAVHAFASRMLMSFSVDKMLLLRQVNLSTNFKEYIYIWFGFLVYGCTT